MEIPVCEKCGSKMVYSVTVNDGNNFQWDEYECPKCPFEGCIANIRNIVPLRGDSK